MSVVVDIQRASGCAEEPGDDEVDSWVRVALDASDHGAHGELTVRFVSRDEMIALNQQFRGRNGPTNVLSFPADAPAVLDPPLLGDIVICSDVVAGEAAEQGKTLTAHWAHMVIHGVLHLLGYDHVESDEAARMEELETQLLSRLSLPAPYANDALPERVTAP